MNKGQIPGFLMSLASGGDAMDKFGGSTERMGKTLNDNAATNLKSWKRQAELAFLGLGNWATGRFRRSTVLRPRSQPVWDPPYHWALTRPVG
jgi:hypothetical protein